MKLKLIAATLLAVSVLLSCKNKFNQKESEAFSVNDTELKTQAPPDTKDNKQQRIPVGNGSVPDSIIGSSTPQPQSHVDWDKKIIKTAVVKLEVKDFKKYNSSIHETVRKFGGYIAQEEQTLTDEKLAAVVSIKVPVETFEQMMNELPGSDTKVMERNISSQDVTGEVIDTRSRLEAKRQVRLKYLDFLKESKNMEDVLKVQAEINELQEEMEAAAGRVEYLSHQSAYSTINLSFYQPMPGFVPVNDSPAFFTRIGNAFKLGAGWIADLLIAMVSIWPLLLTAFAGVFMYKRRSYFKTNPQKP